MRTFMQHIFKRRGALWLMVVIASSPFVGQSEAIGQPSEQSAGNETTPQRSGRVQDRSQTIEKQSQVDLAQFAKQRVHEYLDKQVREQLSTAVRNQPYLVHIQVEIQTNKIESAWKAAHPEKTQNTAGEKAAILPGLPYGAGFSGSSEVRQKQWMEVLGGDDRLFEYVASVAVKVVTSKQITESASSLLAETLKSKLDLGGQKGVDVSVVREDLEVPLEETRKETGGFFSRVLKRLAEFQALIVGLVGILAFCGTLVYSSSFIGRSLSSIKLEMPQSSGGSREGRDPVGPLSQALPIGAPPGAVPVPTPGVGRTGSTAERQWVRQLREVVQHNPKHAATVLKGHLFVEQGRREAAACLRSLGVDSARLITACLNERDRALLSGALSQSSQLTEEQVHRALETFHSELLAHEIHLSGQEVDQWSFLSGLDDEILRRLLDEQDHRGKALILFHLPGAQSSQFYSKMTEEDRGSVIQALFELENLSQEEVVPLAEAIRKRAEGERAKPPRAIADTSHWMSELGSHLRSSDRQGLIQRVENAGRTDQVLALRSKFFSFTDLVMLPNDLVWMVLQLFSPAEMSVLAAGVEEGSPLLEKLMGVMPKQIQEIVLEESQARRLQYQNPMSRRRALREFETLSRRFEEAVKDLDQRGDISLAELLGGGDAAPQSYASESEVAESESITEVDQDPRDEGEPPAQAA